MKDPGLDVDREKKVGRHQGRRCGYKPSTSESYSTCTRQTALERNCLTCGLPARENIIVIVAKPLRQVNKRLHDISINAQLFRWRGTVVIRCVGLQPANFPCPALDLQLMDDQLTTNVGKPSATGQPTRPNQPFIPSGSIIE